MTGLSHPWGQVTLPCEDWVPYDEIGECVKNEQSKSVVCTLCAPEQQCCTLHCQELIFRVGHAACHECKTGYDFKDYGDWKRICEPHPTDAPTQPHPTDAPTHLDCGEYGYWDENPSDGGSPGCFCCGNRVGKITETGGCICNDGYVYDPASRSCGIDTSKQIVQVFRCAAV